MKWNLFGFEITRKDEDTSGIQTFVPPSIVDDVGSANVVGAGAFSGIYNPTTNVSTVATSEAALIMQYREVAMQPEVDTAIEEIISEAIIADENEDSIKLDLTKTNLPDPIKDKVRKSFRKILNLLDFGVKGHDIFRLWYVDGRLNYHIIVDEKNIKDGIRELRFIDPKKLKRIRTAVRGEGQALSVANSLVAKMIEYYIYAEGGVDNKSEAEINGIRISADSIAHADCGIVDPTGKVVLSFLHKAIAAANKLRTLENSMVIYRLVRAPERRLFYVDVGNLPKARAEQYMNSVMQKYKTKLTFDSITGKVRDDRNIMALTEDYWIPRQGGSKSTEIDTLQSGAGAAGATDEVDYFKKELLTALNVPFSRMNPDSTFTMGRSGEISREEARFTKFISRLRTKFNAIFDALLSRELVLTGVMSIEDWEAIRADVKYDYLKDNYFTELLESDVLANRTGVLLQVEPYVGVYYSKEYVWKNVLKMTDEEITLMKSQIAAEKAEDPAAHVPVANQHELLMQAGIKDLEIEQHAHEVEKEAEFAPKVIVKSK